MSDEKQPGALAQVLARGGRSPLAILAVVAAVAAAACHAYVMPMHFGESKAQGIFMATIAALQLLWAVAYVLRPTVSRYVAGIAIALGSIVVWIIAVTIRPPFSPGAETPETIAYVTKAAEAITVLAMLLVPLLYSKRAQTVVSRSLPVVALAILLGIAGGGGAYGAGIIGEKVMPDWMAKDKMDMGAESVTPTSTHDMANMQANASKSPASSNATNATKPTPSSSNSTADPNMPSQPENCMSGMDMPGCTEAQYEALKRAQANVSAKNPDKVLPPVVIKLDAQGAQAPGSITIESGAKSLIIKIEVNDSGTGPWVIAGKGGKGDLTLHFTPSTGSATDVPLTGTGPTAGVDPARPAGASFDQTIRNPASGAWSISLDGQGQNAHVTITVTERFY